MTPQTPESTDTRMEVRKRLFAEMEPDTDEKKPNRAKYAKTEPEDDIRWEHGAVQTPGSRKDKKSQTEPMWGVCGSCLRQIRLWIICQSHTM